MTSELGLEEQVIVALRRISRAVDLHSRDLLQQFGMTGPQLTALWAIERLQPVAMRSLARAIHLSQATLTGILSRLASRGLVRRTRSGTDRRSIVVQLTDHGHAVLKSAPSLVQDRFRRELLKLAEWEQTQMLATLQRVASMMDAGELDAAASVAPADRAVRPNDVARLLTADPAAGHEKAMQQQDEFVR